MPSHGIALCLPVTALAAVDVGSYRLVFVAEGPFLKVVEFATCHVIVKQKVFNNQSIHGVVLEKELKSSDDDYVVRVLAWGGRSFSLSRLLIPTVSALKNGPWLLAGIEAQHDEWILDAKIWPTDSKLDGSSFNRAALITMNNAISTTQDSLQAGRVTSTPKVVKVGCGLQSVLYSAQVVISSSSSLLVAAGTVFGEILVWSCSTVAESPQPACITHHVLRGHRGSIFGVSISNVINVSAFSAPTRLLASCSDDRTVRIWDIGLCLHKPQINTSDAVKLKVQEKPLEETGFGLSNSVTENHNRSYIVSTYGHQSRIWGVFFLHGVEPASGDLPRLASIGEDATLHKWDISIHKAKSGHALQGQIDLISGDGSHSGKNIWSFTHLVIRNAPPLSMTGGADGAVVVRNGRHFATSCNEGALETYKSSFQSVFNSVQGLRFLSKFSMLKNYAWLSETCFVALTDRGRALRGNLRSAQSISDELRINSEERDALLKWELISTPHELRSCSAIGSSFKTGSALISDESGELWLAAKDDDTLHYLCRLRRKAAAIFLINTDSKPCDCAESARHVVWALLTYPGSDDADLVSACQQVDSDSFSCHANLTLQLPSTFIVTSCLFLAQSSLLVLGSRAGALAAYQLLPETHQNIFRLLLCKRHVHGKDAITCLIPLHNVKTGGNFFLSCGRDSHYAVHSLRSSGSQAQLYTVHQASPPFGVNIEGAFFSNSKNLYLYGFRSRDFVLWNETKQMQVYSVDCGGAHRSWAFHPGNSQRSSFIWTQASTFNAFIQGQPTQWRLQEGGHGREIKAMAISSAYTSVPLIATGAEDTTLRFSTLFYEDGQEPQLRYLRTFKKHTNGIQHLQWTPCGKLLFSSAGLEELFVWRISEVPDFGLGAVCVAAMPKETSISDLRITSFDIRMLNADDSGGLQYLVAAVYSNSVLKIFRYSDSNASFELESYGRYKTNCLTQICFLPQLEDQSFYHLLSASTDGGLAIWHPRISEENTPLAEMTELRWNEFHQVHQNSIKALQIVVLSETRLLVVTGGDDNALGFTVVGRSKTNGDNTTAEVNRYEFASLLIPRAHAASITAVSVVKNGSADSESFTVYSTGNDQLLKSWRTIVDIASLEAAEHDRWVEALKVTKGPSYHTAIADVGALCVIDERNNSDNERNTAGLVIAGVGIEVCNFEL